MISAAVLGVDRARETGMLPSLLRTVLEADIDEVVCVTADLSWARRDIQPMDRRLVWHVNPAPNRGQSSSLIAALWASDPRSAGIMFVVADQLGICKELVNSLIEKFKEGTAWIVAASFAGRPQSPLLFCRDLFPDLLQLTGEDVGWSLLEKHSAKTALVDWPGDLSLEISPREAPTPLKDHV